MSCVYHVISCEIRPTALHAHDMHALVVLAPRCARDTGHCMLVGLPLYVASSQIPKPQVATRWLALALLQSSCGGLISPVLDFERFLRLVYRAVSRFASTPF